MDVSMPLALLAQLIVGVIGHVSARDRRTFRLGLGLHRLGRVGGDVFGGG